MENTIYQIYDKLFKKILTLSSMAVINLINGLFDTDYSVDSTIQYNWTEFEDDRLRRILADTIITVNGKHGYHMEAQMTEDEAIIFRVFDYGYAHANRNSLKNDSEYELKFPEPKIIYLYSEGGVPDEYTLVLNFGSQGTFDYKVTTFKFMECSVEELNRRKMVILIPFQLLKLRKIMEKDRTPENLEKLKKLIQNDIIGNINNNLQAGNITPDDARKLKRQTHKLYEHIYAHYDEMKELNEMTDESLMLDIDIIEEQHEKRIQELQEAIERRHEKQIQEVHDVLERRHEKQIQEMHDVLERRHEKQIQEMHDVLERQYEKQIQEVRNTLEKELQDKDKEIELLKKQMKELKTRE